MGHYMSTAHAVESFFKAECMCVCMYTNVLMKVYTCMHKGV